MKKCYFSNRIYKHTLPRDVNQQLSRSLRLYFSLEGKRSGQITKCIEAEAIRLVDFAVQKNKPIVLEKLDTTLSKTGGRYRNRKQNRRMSMFAYKKIQESIKNRAAKMGIAVFEVNPAFTSQIGKMKYMKKLHISIHQAASYVIGRRGMHLKEKVPIKLRPYVKQKEGEHHWKKWSVLTKTFKGLRPHLFYHVSQQVPALPSFCRKSERTALQNGGCIGAGTSQDGSDKKREAVVTAFFDQRCLGVFGLGKGHV